MHSYQLYCKQAPYPKKSIETTGIATSQPAVPNPALNSMDASDKQRCADVLPCQMDSKPGLWIT